MYASNCFGNLSASVLSFRYRKVVAHRDHRPGVVQVGPAAGAQALDQAAHREVGRGGPTLGVLAREVAGRVLHHRREVVVRPKNERARAQAKG